LLRAIIFDVDGVIVDSERVIARLTKEMAALEGFRVTEDEYMREYLPYSDKAIIEKLYRKHGRAVDPARVAELVAWKSRAYNEIIRDGLPAMPGATEFVRRAAAAYPLAIASGSWRQEIEHLLAKLDLRQYFAVLVAADDCAQSKPQPEGYLKALTALQQLPSLQQPPLQASQCLAIEDAPGGIEAAQAAGMKCLALAHSRPPDELRHADWTFRGFAEVDLAAIAAAFAHT